jgi:hypothetical protein
MIGARVILERAGQTPREKRVHSDASFASASDLRVHFGIGSAAEVRVLVHWPSGLSERFPDVEAGRYQDLVEGSGEAVD